MVASKYVSPYLNADAFNCPLCGVYARQAWAELRPDWSELQRVALRTESPAGFRAARCEHCKNFSIWRYGKMLFPEFFGGVPQASPDLPSEILDDYNEAAAILAKSPRGAAALLRLAMQKLCEHLGEKGINLNDDIGNLVKKGLPNQIQQALDIVRLIGNNAVHPGQLDLRDDRTTACSLFELVNLIADYMITRPKQIEEIYQRLPQSSLEAIRQRDEVNIP